MAIKNTLVSTDSDPKTPEGPRLIEDFARTGNTRVQVVTSDRGLETITTTLHGIYHDYVSDSEKTAKERLCELASIGMMSEVRE